MSSRLEALEQYNTALKSGLHYYKQAVKRGQFPYPVVLDEIVDSQDLTGEEKIGFVNVPSELVVGTRTAGPTTAMAGNFMPLLKEDSEFGAKWVSLCEAHLGEEGIREPVKCYEYLGKFYVQEGNKRVSVLKSYGAPVIPAVVYRLIPKRTGEPEIEAYYDFMRFYELSGFYGMEMQKSGEYEALQAALGFEPEHIWTETERLSFKAGFNWFKASFDRMNTEHISTTVGEALLVWLGVFSFQEIKDLTATELDKKLLLLWPDIRSAAGDSETVIEVQTLPEESTQGFISSLFSGRKSQLSVAFIYAFDPEISVWTRAHDHGREYLEEHMRERVKVRIYRAYDHNYAEAMEQAVQEGAETIFATTPPMIAACRRIAALYPKVHVFNCAISMPYTGVRMYYSRQYECKFITGAIAGAMADNDLVGYIENYPILGVPTSINAFALGVRMTNPRAKVILRWSCLPGDPLKELTEAGVKVISNRDATNPNNRHWALEWGTYKLQESGLLLPLAVPCWDWGQFYVRVINGILDGTYETAHTDKAINYWWGLDSGIINIQLGDTMPEGVRSLAKILTNGIVSGSLDLFQTRIVDQQGNVRNTGDERFSVEDLINMDWLCNNVTGSLPDDDTLTPQSRQLVRILGFHRDRFLSEAEESRL